MCIARQTRINKSSGGGGVIGRKISDDRNWRPVHWQAPRDYTAAVAAWDRGSAADPPRDSGVPGAVQLVKLSISPVLTAVEVLSKNVFVRGPSLVYSQREGVCTSTACIVLYCVGLI